MMLQRNKEIVRLTRNYWFTATILFFMAACSASIVQPSSSPSYSEPVFLTPYYTDTPTDTLAPILSRPTNTPLPPPTSTPFTHTVKKEETLLGIAFKYGLKLEDLLAANPGVNIHFLSVGTVLVIPLDNDLPTTTPTVPPPLLHVSEPKCYGSTDNRLNCLALVKNPFDEAYEKLILKFELYASDGKLVSEQFVVPPLDRILPESELPISASFSGLDGDKITNDYSARFTLASALPVPTSEEQIPQNYRYLELSVSDLQVHVSDAGNSAQISGKISALSGTTSIWLIAVAYDIDQKPVGVRRLEINDICPITPDATLESTSTPGFDMVCTDLSFELSVYSLGPAIDRVEVSGEAHR